MMISHLDLESLLMALSAEDLWDSEESVFKTLPNSYSERNMSKWLNMIGQAIGRPYGKKCLHLWSSACHNLTPSGSSSLLKPDLVLVDRPTYQAVHSDSKERVHWFDIRAIGEVTSEHRYPRRMYETVNQKSYLLFLTQCICRFVPALSFDGEGNFSLTVTDRQGQARMALMSLTASGTESAFLILKILACLMYGPEEDVGIDPTMIRGPNNTIASIYINKQKFDVDRLIYRMQSLIGRGTQVWVVKNQKKSYILKDSWVQSGRVGSEIEFLTLMKGHKFLEGRVPNIFEGEDININGVLDSTGRYRVDTGQVNFHRIHRRLATEPIGEPLIKFRSRAEFIQVMIELVSSEFIFILLNVLKLNHQQFLSISNVLLKSFIATSAQIISC
jgi:Fungal protein kinase